ncbi:hypothetical protein DEA98_09930 [Brucella pseudogrignonensis]|uniref:Uncharacterized protein n=1 Tax=Brucella pseudogrignonensis TaxID=419475 RepID=A0A7Y3T6V7_9HYPH|nr:hypothetical protein [Brucella pseudogrignonensis]MCM0751517.1 hypothetical protein [Brucella pseudogrignonensis]NNV22087.1 hypothetical protein [Brucella pseudogrignonensis]
MAAFDRMDRVISKTVDRVNAIPFVFTPQASTPNGRSGPDTARKIVNGKGIFDYISVEYGVQLGVRRSYREANDLRSLQSGRDPQLSIDRRYFPAGAEEPKQGDLVSFPTRPELPDFQVISSQRDGLSRVVLMLVQLGGQA